MTVFFFGGGFMTFASFVMAVIYWDLHWVYYIIVFAIITMIPYAINTILDLKWGRYEE